MLLGFSFERDDIWDSQLMELTLMLMAKLKRALSPASSEHTDVVDDLRVAIEQLFPENERMGIDLQFGQQAAAQPTQAEPYYDEAQAKWILPVIHGTLRFGYVTVEGVCQIQKTVNLVQNTRYLVSILRTASFHNS